MKPRYWSLAIVLLLVNYIIFATLFTILFEGGFNSSYATRTPEPTFTPAPAQPIIIVPTPIPVIPELTPTATRVIQPESNAGPDISNPGQVIQASLVQSTSGQTNSYHYQPSGWASSKDANLTRFSGEIRDANGNPVDGVIVQAACGNYSILSHPSGSAGSENETWPPGYYEIRIDAKPVPCIWFLTVVNTADGQTIEAALSESVPVEVTLEKSVITANWQSQ
jgi:hypothetical protein